MLLVAGCGANKAEISEPDPASAKGFSGGVAADEPRAALVARNILASGGNAADAVVAGALALTVTYPGAAALGAGGICIALDPVNRKADSIDFLPQLPPGGGGVPIPGMLRGLALLQGTHGQLRWEAVVSPAEALARFGERTSRAFVQSAAEANPPVAREAGLARLLLNRSGAPRSEGEQVSQNELAATLGRIRSAGAGDFYQGMLARQVLADAARIGGAIRPEDLRGYTAQIGKPIEVPFQFGSIVYASPNAQGGAIAAWLLEQGFEPAGRLSLQNVGKTKPREFVTAIGQAYRGTGGNAPLFEQGSTSLSAIDKTGRAVACSFSMGRAFGARRIGSETGILFAAAPGGPGDETAYLAALAVGNYTAKQSFAAGAVSGGAPGAAALAQVLLDSLGSNGGRLGVAMAKPRLFQPAPDAPVLHEPGYDAALLGAITERGVPKVEVRRLGRVTMAVCGNGVPRSPESCRVAADPRGFGLAAGDEF
ncbi:gamma-glutamyltransferase [Ferrovibrio sp.]|uniref:gamma-glutamyltransferase n=1 Tax=Ferrovibrio sp. TaxID=1917215 RepID=UPI001B4965F3|nr:gamma-glutamyltransferase [Ferrovibrio sp.]MBP7065824.1 gamma-glutamyltransferase [Ferrovibrio sp.]